MNKQEIIDAINEYVTTNGLQEITGNIMNVILKAIANIIPDDTMLTSSYGGIVKPDDTISTTPGIGRWFIAESGNYPNNGGFTFVNTKLNILSYNGVDWGKSEVLIPPGDSFIEISFSESVKLNVKKSISKTSLSSDIYYTYDPIGSLSNALRVDEIIPNGYTISFSNKFTVNIQPDIDYDKPISVLFQKPITPNLKIFVIVVNISEVENSVVVPRYRINPTGGSIINTWFEWFEFPSHTVASTDSIFNVGLFTFQGVNYITTNFSPVGEGADERWAYGNILESDWHPNTVYDNITDGNGVRFKTGSVKPTTLLVANTANETLDEI